VSKSCFPAYLCCSVRVSWVLDARRANFVSYQHRCSTAHAFIKPSSPTHLRISQLCLNSTCASSRDIEYALLTRPNVTFQLSIRELCIHGSVGSNNCL
jgi:hypothetical protein